MLYDIAPPLIFFGSLTGVLVVISRIILRLRRNEFHTAIKAEAVAAPSPRKVNRMLKPSSKSVQAMTSRLAATGAAVKQTAASTTTVWQDFRANRAAKKREKELAANQEERKQAAHVQATQAQEPAKLEGATISPPKTSWRDRVSALASQATTRVKETTTSGTAAVTAAVAKRQADRAAKKAAAAKEAAEAEALAAKQAAETPAPTPEPKVRLASKPKPEPKPKPKPVSKRGMSKLKETIKHRSEPKKEAPVMAARAELTSHHPERVEAIIIPYIMEHPQDAEAYLVLGEAALATGSWSEACEVFDQVVKIDPDTPAAYRNLGQACLKAGKYSQALPALQRAHEADPSDVTIIKNLLSLAKSMDNPALQKSFEEKLGALEHPEKVTA